MRSRRSSGPRSRDAKRLTSHPRLDALRAEQRSALARHGVSDDALRGWIRSRRRAGLDPALDRVALLGAQHRAAERHHAILRKRSRLRADRDEQIALRRVTRYDAHPARAGLETQVTGADRGAVVTGAQRTRRAEHVRLDPREVAVALCFFARTAG